MTLEAAQRGTRLSPRSKVKSEIILSVCIATYNRGEFLGATLQSIGPQLDENIEVIIVDGASTDNSEYVALYYQAKYPQIKYFQLQKKGGVDQDYCEAVALAKGVYCWLFTDDDILKPNAFTALLTAIKSRDYAIIVVNAALYNRGLATCYVNNYLGFDGNREYLSAEAQETFFKELANYLSFIGSVVIKRDLWNQRAKEQYFGSEFIHVAVIFQEKINEPIAVISDPLILIRMNNSQWIKRGFEIWIIKWPELIWSFSAFSDKAKRSICPRYPSQNLRKLLYYRAMSAYSLEHYNRCVRNQRTPFLSNLLAHIIASLPGTVVNLFLILYALVRRRFWMVEELSTSPYYYRNAARTNVVNN